MRFFKHYNQKRRFGIWSFKSIDELRLEWPNAQITAIIHGRGGLINIASENHVEYNASDLLTTVWAFSSAGTVNVWPSSTLIVTHSGNRNGYVESISQDIFN